MPKQTSPVIKMNGRNQMKNQLVSQFASLVKESVKEAEKNQVFNPEIPADIKLDLKSANNQLAYVRQQGSDLGKTFSDAFENGLKKSLTPNKDASVKELRQFRDQLSDQIKEMNKGFGKGGPTDYKQWKEFQGLIKAYENVNEELRKQILVQSNGLTSYSIPQKKADLSKILKIDLPELGNKARGEQIDEALKGLLKTALDNAEKAAQAEVQSVKDRINRFQTESALKQSGVGQKDTVRQLNAANKELENAKNIQAQTVDDVRKKLQELIGVYDSTGKKLDEIYEKDLNRLTIAEQDELTALEDKQDAVQQKFRAIYEWMMNVKGIDFGDLKQFKDFYDTIDTDRISSDNAQKQGFEQSIASSSETIKKTLALVKELQSHLGVLANIGHGLADLQGDDVQGVAQAALDEQREQLEGERQLRQELEASNAQMVSRLEILEQSIKRCEELERQLTEANSIIEKYQSSGAVTPEESQAMQEELRTAKEQLELQKQARQELEASKADAEAKLQTVQRETDELKEQIKLLEEQENSGISEDEYSALVQNYKVAGEQLQAVNKELETTRSELEKLKQADQQSEVFKEIGGPEKALEKIKAYEAQIQELEQKAKGLNATLDEVNQKLNDSVSKSDHSKELDQLREKLNAAQKAAEDSDKLLADAKAQIAQKDTEIAALEAKANRSGVTGDGTMSAGDVGTLSDDIRNLNVLIDSLKGLYDEIQQKQSGLSSTVGSEVKDLELLDMALLEVTEDVDGKTNQFKREQDAVQASIGAEIGSLELLDAAILEVTEDVNNKTAQFQKESADVQAYIGKEIEDLRKLQHELEGINTLLSNQSQTIDKNKGALSQLSQNAADGGVLIDIAALQTAADSLRDLIEGSINQHTKAFDVNVQKISQSSSAMSNVFKDITTAAQKVVDALQKIANPKDVYNDKKLLVEISGLRDAVSALRKSINNILPKFTDLQNAFQPIIDAGQPTQNALTKVEEAAESAAKAIEGFGTSVGAEASNANGQKRRGGNRGGGSNQEAATNLEEWEIEERKAMAAIRGAFKHQLEINDLEKRLAQDVIKYNIDPDQVNNIRSYLAALTDTKILPSLIKTRKDRGYDAGDLENRLAAQIADKDKFRAGIPDGQFTGLVGEYVTQMMAHVEDIERAMVQFDNAQDTLEVALSETNEGSEEYAKIDQAISDLTQYYFNGFDKLQEALDHALGLIMARANAAKEDRDRKAAAKLGAQYAKEAERQAQRETKAEEAALKQANKKAEADEKQAQKQAEKDYQANLDKMLAQRTTTAKLLGKGDLSQPEVDALQKAYRDFTEAHEQISRVGELTEQMREAQVKYDRALSDMLSRIAAEAKQQADITAKETQSAEQSQAEERYRKLVRSATKQTETIISLTEKQKHSPLSNQEQNDLEKAQTVLWEAVEKIGQVTKKTDAMLKADQQFEEAAAQASVDIRARIADREAQLTNKYGNVQVSALGNPLAFSSSSDVSQYLKQYLADSGVDFMRDIKFGNVDSATGLQRISVIFKDIDGIAKELITTFNTVDGSLRMVINDTSETFEAEEKRGIAAYKVLQDTEKQYTKYLDKYVEYRKVLQDDSLDAESKEEKLKELQLTDEEISELDKLHKMREKQKEDLKQLSVLTQRLIEQQAIYEQERGQVDQGRSDNVREMQSWLDAQSSEKSIKEASDAEIKYITLTNQLIEAQKDLNALNEKSKHYTVVSDEDAKKVDALNHKIEELQKKLAAIRAQGFDGGVFDQKDAEYAEIMNTLPSGAQEAYERAARQKYGELVSGGIKDDVAARKALEEFAGKLNGKLIDIKFGKTKGDLQEITGIVDTMDGGFKKLNATMNTADGTLRTFTEDASMKETLGPLDIMLKNLASHQRSLISYLATFKSFYQIIDYAKRAAAQIKELDSAFVELRKVSNDSQAELEAFRSKAFSLGNNVGATGSQIIQAAAGWEQLGYSIDEASKLAQVSTIYQNVADGMESSSEATEDLISTLKAFYGGEASKAIDVVDALNEVSNNYAVSAADLGGILKRSSSSMAVANNSFEETLAMGTAMNEILQNQETAGATLKMLSLRIRGAKAELEEAGEEVDSMADSSSKLQEEIKGLTGGFDILEADGKSFKSTYEIMKGIAEVWDDMTDVSRAALLEKIAGKNRAQGVAQLLSNWSQVDKVLKTISEDEGSAERENRVRMESISGRITKLQNQGQELSTAIINADVFKEGISLVTEFVNLLTLAISKFGSFGIAAGALGAGVSIMTGGKGQLPARPLKRYVATRNEPEHCFDKAA